MGWITQTLGVCMDLNVLRGQTESMTGYDWVREIGGWENRHDNVSNKIMGTFPNHFFIIKYFHLPQKSIWDENWIKAIKKLSQWFPFKTEIMIFKGRWEAQRTAHKAVHHGHDHEIRCPHQDTCDHDSMGTRVYMAQCGLPVCSCLPSRHDV